MIRNLFIALLLVLFFNNYSYAQKYTIEVKNNMNFNRKEIVALKAKDFIKAKKSLQIINHNSGEYIQTQWVDYESYGVADEVLFQADVPARSTVQYEIVFNENIKITENNDVAFARFVPERSDDFAWENDKVAFRVYGPKGQEEAIRGVAGSTLSSGIDIWLKRVNYSVINKWYAEHVKSPGYYHTDHGEGYDPYHVGNSRGTGGTGVWINDSLQVSENFTDYKIIANGPLRTIFELTYKPWSDYKIKETKRVTLDLGSNFSKFEISTAPNKKIKNYAIGIALHNNEGNVGINKREGWFRYWEVIDDSFVGEGIVIDPSLLKDAFANISKTHDQSNLLVLVKPVKKITYYAGFAWQKSNQIHSLEDWDLLLKRQALIVKNPLEIKIIKN